MSVLVCKHCKAEIPANGGGSGSTMRLRYVTNVAPNICQKCKREIELKAIDERRRLAVDQRRRARAGF